MFSKSEFNEHMIIKKPTVNLHNKVGKIYYINLKHRIDRQKEFLSNFIAQDNNRIERIDAVSTPKQGYIGCLLSHIKALEKMKKDNIDIGFICEDDLLINDLNICNKFIDTVIKKFPDWNVIMIGHNTFKYENTNTNINDKYKIIQILDSQTAHGYIINKKYLNTLLDVYKQAYNNYKKTTVWNELLYDTDQCWKILQPKGKWYATNPIIGLQRPSHSDIGNFYINQKLNVSQS